MKVALCMRGAVSIYQNRDLFDRGSAVRPDEIYANKRYVNINAVYHSIRKHIIKANPSCTFDTYLQCWNPDLQERLVSLYKPKAFMFEDNAVYRDEIISRCATTELFAVPSQLLATTKSLLLMEQSGITYDMVILYRYDVLLWKDMKLDQYHVTKHVYSSGFVSPLRGKGDFHFVFHPKNASYFYNCYYHLSVEPYHGFIHHWLEDMAVIYGISLQKDHIMPYLDQDVIRKIHPFQMNRLLSYGCTMEDINDSNRNTHIYYMEYVIWVSILASVIVSLRHGYQRMPLYFFSFCLISFLLCYVLPFEYVIVILIFLMVLIS